MEICPCRIPVQLPLRTSQFPTKLAPAGSQTSKFYSCSSAVSKTNKLEWESQNRMFILGMGFVGQFFAKNLKNKDWVVTGTCTSMKKKMELQEKGFEVCVFNANEPESDTLKAMKSYTHLLVSIPPVGGIGDLNQELLRSVLLDGNIRWLGYLSSTSVYGHCDGAWVDEDYPASPTSEVGKLRLVAEEGWLNLGWDIGLSTQVFRLGGIYGPCRSAVDTIIKQEALSKVQKLRSSRQYTSRVHVEDICQALNASIYLPSSRRIYNIVDDDPAPREEVFAYAKDLIEKKWPGQVKQITSSEEPVLSIEKDRSRSEKRVSNLRMKRELGVKLIHSSYRSGLISIIEHMERPCQYSSGLQIIL